MEYILLYIAGMKQWIVLVCMSVLWAQCGPSSNEEKDGHPRIVIETQYGDIEAELYPDKAPQSVAAFLRFVDSGFYQRSSFYRILNQDNQPMGSAPAELIQGGLWGTGNKREYLKGIPHENTQQTGLRHINGALSLARQDTGTANTEFFICIGDQPGFDFGGDNNGDGQGYAVFGQVTKGMDVVQKIYRRPEENQYFTPQVDIITVRRK
ncbi:peptidylprolyl isomerase [Phnomibacter ginsenosidimutans]|nr:peptidylprolyl isomerase [Phnomibacter ginsenosidimutans]